MSTVTTPRTTRPDDASSFIAAAEAPGVDGVGGWLLVLCLMLTIVGPIISTWIVGREFDALAARFATSRAAQWAMITNIALTTCAVLIGIYAGIRLWTVKPNAVRLAKAALLFGLAVDLCTTTISSALAAVSPADAELFYDVLRDVIPSLVFFTLCFGYLNKSRRVEATYGLE